MSQPDAWRMIRRRAAAAGISAEIGYHTSVFNDPHLNDRGFWKEVAHPELGRSFVYPGEAAIYNGSPWRISRRAPLIGEHNVEIFCTELGLSRNELSILAENRVI
jgi:crotonobetainyl-CoA:carnitine CoA-transferase CaiB-like acyl-CoA transferase